VPTKRVHILRAPQRHGLSPDELAWLSGRAQLGTNKFWPHRRDDEKLARCRALLESHAHLVPAGRLPRLLDDLARWAQRPARRNGHAD
jgi:hypothetical protein